jgi:excisionase family DNA binding protein
MPLEALPDALAQRLRHLREETARVLRLIDSRQRTLARMRALGEQIDELYSQQQGRVLAEAERGQLLLRQEQIQAQIEKRRGNADAAWEVCRTFFEAVEEALQEAARWDPALLAAFRALRQLAPGRSGDPKRLVADVLEVRELLQQALAAATSSLNGFNPTPPTPPPPEPTLGLWTVRQTAEYLSVSPKQLYRLAQRGAIPHVRLGRSLRFQRQELDAWVAAKSLRPRRR